MFPCKESGRNGLFGYCTLEILQEDEEKVAFSEGDPIRWNVGMTEYP